MNMSTWYTFGFLTINGKTTQLVTLIMIIKVSKTETSCVSEHEMEGGSEMFSIEL